MRAASWILRRRRLVIVLAAALAVVSALLMTTVRVNYDMAEYLPDDAGTTRALEAYGQSFGGALPNMNVYAPNVTVAQALSLKQSLAAIEGVSSVLWLDDVADVRVPLESLDEAVVSAWYQNGGALFLVAADANECVRIVAEVNELAPDALLSGDAVNQSVSKSVSMQEIARIMLYVIPLGVLILLFATRSWIEPFLYLITIGVAILMNEGLNAVGGEVSYITRATGALLQLAVSMDYAVFLLHRFGEFRDEGFETGEAMKRAMVASFRSITASAMTTVFGFLALALMRFKIGADMGYVLARGVLLSFAAVMIVLPALAMGCSKLIEKTRHRQLLPSFRRLGRFAARACVPIGVIVALLAAPAFMAQRQNTFVYGSSGMHSDDSPVKQDANTIGAIFGAREQLVLLVPEGDTAREAALTKAVESVERVTGVVSYASAAGVQIPEAMLSDAQLAQLRSGGYARLVVTADVPDEGDAAFALVAALRDTAAEYYGDSYLLVGQSAVNRDLRDTITGDNLTVLLAAIVSIALVLLICFKSVSLPLILLATIESAIWINMSVPYFMGDTMNYIGYQIISAIQLGATIDYGILFTQWYLDGRKTMRRMDASRYAVSRSAGSILTSASILIVAGFMLYVNSTNGIISQMGLILGRGTAISAGLVLLFLPALLMALDRVIRATTIHKKGDFVDER